jgi:protein involved in polysaccharide export with SLBB domain
MMGLQRFGDAFFSSIQSSFMPINMPNLSSDYIVDVGDSFNLQLTGKSSDDYELTVQRDGSLIIPKIGKLNVAGKSLMQVESSVSSLIQTTSLGITHFLSLTKLRDIQILMLGGIQSPGIYTISGGSSVLSALNVAGGISDNGSYRKIELRRGGEVIHTVDLYDIFIFGKFDSTFTLRSGDSIFVSPSSLNIPVSGGVNNSAIYEALPNQTLAEMINFAGGFSESFIGFNSVLVNRVDLNRSEIIKVPVDKINEFKVLPRDSIQAPSFSNVKEPMQQVEIIGKVKRPGKYYFLQGETLSSVIKRAGGYKAGAYIYGGALFREDALEKEKIYAEINYTDTLSYIVGNIGKPNTTISTTALELIMEELKSKQYTGRVIANFNTEFLRSNPGMDLVLADNDKIVIPELEKVVYLFGEFKNPINTTYSSDLSLKNYLRLAGGLKKSANKDLIVIDPDGQAHVYSSGLIGWSRDSIDIYPGSIIYAPRDVGKLEGVMYAATLSPILSSLALSLASLNSINN